MIVRAQLRVKPLPQDAHLWGRSLLRHCLNKKFGIDMDHNAVVYDRWGKPYLKEHPGIAFSISHSERRIACIVSDRAPVGIDVEKVRGYNRHAAMHALNDFEREAVNCADDPDREFFKYWTLKESCIKALGMGLCFPMNKISILIDRSCVRSNMKNCSFILLEDEDEYITSVCCKRHHYGEAAAHGKLY